MRTKAVWLIVALVFVFVTDARAGELCHMDRIDQFRKDASQYTKKEQDRIIKAATDLEVQLRGKLEPPYTVCAGVASWKAEVVVWTEWQGQDCDDRYKIVPHTFEGQTVMVYCKDAFEFD